jgi:hypothetical protein
MVAGKMGSFVFYQKTNFQPIFLLKTPRKDPKDLVKLIHGRQKPQ